MLIQDMAAGASQAAVARRLSRALPLIMAWPLLLLGWTY